MNKHIVTICGHSLCLLSDESEAYIREIVRTIDGIITQFNSRRPTQTIDAETRLIYAAIQLADELFKERMENERLTESLRALRAQPAVSPQELEDAERKIALLCRTLEHATEERDAAKAELEAFIAGFEGDEQ